MPVVQDSIRLIGGKDDPPPPAPPPPGAPQAALERFNAALLLTALRAVSQRALTAVTDLFSLFLAASVWVLADRALPSPTWPQLALLAGYGVFVIALDAVRRRRSP
jgi:hypothetical protein